MISQPFKEISFARNLDLNMHLEESMTKQDVIKKLEKEIPSRKFRESLTPSSSSELDRRLTVQDEMVRRNQRSRLLRQKNRVRSRK